ncbi:MAG: flagellar motor protein MotA, partial [Geminicoccaceae bacterium]
LMVKLAESQSEMRPLLQRLADLASSGGFGLDETSRHHLRNVDVHMSRLIEELNIGRQYTVQELRSEIRLLARTIAALAEEGER